MKKKVNKLTDSDIQKIHSTDFNKVKGVVSAETVLNNTVGEAGTSKREAFNAKAKAWYYGELLRERRKELGITQKQLAEKIGRERTYINRIEKGDTDLQLSSFFRIAEALDVQINITVHKAYGKSDNKPIPMLAEEQTQYKKKTRKKK